MFDHERDRLGLSGEPARWPPIDTYDPDRQRSYSALFIQSRGDDIVFFLQVKGLGVVVLRVDTVTASAGLSSFSKADIGYAPNL